MRSTYKFAHRDESRLAKVYSLRSLESDVAKIAARQQIHPAVATVIGRLESMASQYAWPHVSSTSSVFKRKHERWKVWEGGAGGVEASSFDGFCPTGTTMLGEVLEGCGSSGSCASGVS